jgi:hypothetical protein
MEQDGRKAQNSFFFESEPTYHGKKGNTMEGNNRRKQAKALWLEPLARRLNGSDSKAKAPGKRRASKA